MAVADCLAQTMSLSAGSLLLPLLVLHRTYLFLLGGLQVYLGRWRWHGFVAIKHLVDADEQREKSFLREAELLQSLRHPNIVLFLGACLEPGRVCRHIAVELV